MKSQTLYDKAKQLIPGGTQLLSKRPEQFLPDQWPAYYAHAQGAEVEDLDGNTYIDMSIMGVGACILGYSDPDVDVAAMEALRRGVMCTLNAPEEVDLAELLCELHPWAQMVRYSRSGGEAASMAVRIARAHTGRDVVAVCGYHGWSDFYLAANLADERALDGHLLPGLPPGGIPRGLAGTTVTFRYNRFDELEAILDRHRDEIAAIVMEPQRGEPPEDGFLEKVREAADRAGAVLVFDEVTTGFRMTTGGIHLLHDVSPDLAVFAKAISNGYAMSAVIGRSEVMDSVQSTFISSTNWTERIGPAAALATIEKHRRCKVTEYIGAIGTSVMEGWRRAADETGLEIHVEGLPSLNHFSFSYDNSAELMTLFIQEMLAKGFLAYGQFKPSYAHRQEHVESYLRATEETFAEIAESVAKGDTAKRLRGPVMKTGFYRLVR